MENKFYELMTNNIGLGYIFIYLNIPIFRGVSLVCFVLFLLKNLNICLFINFIYLKQKAYFLRIHNLMLFIHTKYI